MLTKLQLLLRSSSTIMIILMLFFLWVRERIGAAIYFIEILHIKSAIVVLSSLLELRFGGPPFLWLVTYQPTAVHKDPFGTIATHGNLITAPVMHFLQVIEQQCGMLAIKQA